MEPDDITDYVHHPGTHSDLARPSWTLYGCCQQPKFFLNIHSMVQRPFTATLRQGVKVSVDHNLGFGTPCDRMRWKSEAEQRTNPRCGDKFAPKEG